MAKKRPEPEKSVDTEEEPEEEDASSDGSDSEPEPPLISRTQVSKKPPKRPEPKRVSDSESEADSDSNPKAATTPTKKPRSKHAAGKPTSLTKSAAGTKRPAAAANGEAKESKKSKKKPSGEVNISVTEDSKKKAVAEIDPKKQLFQRLWSEEDEIAVLKGMIEYAEEKNADPVADLNAFHDYIRESLQIDASRTQLQDKIRRLRKKYENNTRKEKKGKEITFSKTHEQNAYDLSKTIWGGGHKAAAQNGSGVVKAGESSKLANNKVEALDEEKNMDVDMNVAKSLNSIGGSLFGKSLDELSEWIEKNKGYVSEEEMIEMEEKWKALKITEVELFLKRAKLIYEQGKLVLDALKKK